LQYIESTLSNALVAVFLDLIKAFDTVNHKLLLEKFKRYGIRGLALDLSSSYLHNLDPFTSCLQNRYQFVYASGVRSDKISITFGVPPGSTLKMISLIFQTVL